MSAVPIIIILSLIASQYYLTCKYWFRFSTRLHKLLWSIAAWLTWAAGVLATIDFSELSRSNLDPVLMCLTAFLLIACSLLMIRSWIISVYVDHSPEFFTDKSHQKEINVLQTFATELKTDIKNITPKETHVIRIYCWQIAAFAAALPMAPINSLGDEMKALAIALCASLVIQAAIMITTPRKR